MKKKQKVEEKSKIRPPSKTIEGREREMISLAVDLAEQQLRDGTASSQIIAHFLKLGSTKEMIERDILKKQAELLTAKTDAIHSSKKVEELYIDALNAMRAYSGTISDG